MELTPKKWEAMRVVEAKKAGVEITYIRRVSEQSVRSVLATIPETGVLTAERVDELERQLAEAKDSANEARNELQRVLAKECCAEEIESLKRQLAEARKAAVWVPIDEEHLPPEGYEVYGFVQGVEAVIHKFERPFRTARQWLSHSWTHYRPINAPQAKESHD
jgi:DNA-binding transcriptional MerR regulator